MRPEIDRDKCQGHNRCYALAPELVDHYGSAMVLNDGIGPAELEEIEEKARLAIANCPEFAISVAAD